MKREQRLRKAADFQRVREAAERSWAHPLLILYAAPNEEGHTRIGITVGKRVAKSAVKRNRIRRRIREAFRLRYDHTRPGFDLVFIARNPSLQANWVQIREAVDSVIQRAGLDVSPS
jgi:ribonuclease P protein component